MYINNCSVPVIIWIRFVFDLFSLYCIRSCMEYVISFNNNWIKHLIRHFRHNLFFSFLIWIHFYPTQRKRKKCFLMSFLLIILLWWNAIEWNLLPIEWVLLIQFILLFFFQVSILFVYHKFTFILTMIEFSALYVTYSWFFLFSLAVLKSKMQ